MISYLRHVKRLGIWLPRGRSRSIINIHEIVTSRWRIERCHRRRASGVRVRRDAGHTSLSKALVKNDRSFGNLQAVCCGQDPALIDYNSAAPRDVDVHSEIHADANLPRPRKRHGLSTSRDAKFGVAQHRRVGVWRRHQGASIVRRDARVRGQDAWRERGQDAWRERVDAIASVVAVVQTRHKRRDARKTTRACNKRVRCVVINPFLVTTHLV